MKGLKVRNDCCDRLISAMHSLRGRVAATYQRDAIPFSVLEVGSSSKLGLEDVLELIDKSDINDSPRTSLHFLIRFGCFLRLAQNARRRSHSLDRLGSAVVNLGQST